MTARNRLVPSVYLVLKDGDEVLLLQRQNAGFRDGEYSLVAGHVESGESCTEAMVREAREEANLDLSESDLSFAHVPHRNAEPDERVDVFFLAESWDGPIENSEPEKCGDRSWFPIDNLPEQTIPYIEAVLEDIRDVTA
jgi:ADP-ribose pyrophosphatase YjhB (NUDIX family)